MPATTSTTSSSGKISALCRRLFYETLFIGLLGGMVMGLAWEMGFPHVGLIVAAIIWILGDPVLELGRFRHTSDSSQLPR
jgi:hypothetical protein